MFCTHCGQKIEDDALFCPHCGERTEPDSPATAENSGGPDEEMQASVSAQESESDVAEKTDRVENSGEISKEIASQVESNSSKEGEIASEREETESASEEKMPDASMDSQVAASAEEETTSMESQAGEPAAPLPLMESESSSAETKLPEPVSGAEESTDSQKPKWGKKMLFAGLAAALLIVAAALLLLVLRPVSIDLNAYITVEFSGYDTLGEGCVIFDQEKFREDFQGKIQCRGKKAQQLRERTQGKEEFREKSMELLLRELQNYSLEPGEDLKNQDSVKLVWQLDALQLEKDFRIKLAFREEEIQVEGLKKPEIVKVLDHFQVSFQNYDPYGTARLVYETAPWLDTSVSIALDRQENLKNGDTVTLTVEIPPERIREYLDREGVLLDLGTGQKTFTVSDLPVSEAGDLEPVTLTVWFHGSTVTPDASAQVMEQLNAYLKFKLNVTLEPIWGTWGDFDTSAPLALQSGKKVDIVFTSDWSGNEYNRFSAEGYYVKLDEMLDTYAPELKATIPQTVWDCTRTKGREGMGIYGVPALTDTANQNGWLVNADRLAKLGYDPDAVQTLDYHSPEFGEMLQAAKDQWGEDFYPLVIEPQILERMVNHCASVAGSMNSLLGYSYDPEHPSQATEAGLVNRFATEEFAAFAAKTYEYAQKGFIAPACMNYNDNTQYRSQAMASGTYLFVTADYTFGMEQSLSFASGADVRMVPASAPFADAMSCQKAMMAISQSSENPERALMLLNLINTDSKAMTMLNYGLADFTYRDNRDGSVDFIQTNRQTYFPWTFGMGNVRILPPTSMQGMDYWKEFGAFYDSAEALPHTGFVFQPSLVSVENEQVDSVIMEYAYSLCAGAVDPEEALPQFLSALDKAGAQAVLREASKQMEDYLDSTAPEN